MGKKQVFHCTFSRSQENYLETISPDQRQVKYLLSDILGILYGGLLFPFGMENLDLRDMMKRN